MQFRTPAIHVGQQHDPATGAVVPPIQLASTFVQPDATMTAAYDSAPTVRPTRHAFVTLPRPRSTPTSPSPVDGRHALQHSSVDADALGKCDAGGARAAA